MAALTEWTNDLIGRGVAASRPAAGIKGRLYIATDTNAISRDNGTSWDALVVGSSLTVKDEGGALATAADTLDFVGAGVVASGTGATKTITIAGSSALTVEEVDGSPTDAAITKIVFPNDSVSIASHIATIRDAPKAFIGCSISGTSTAMSTAAYTSMAAANADTFDSDGFHDPSSNNTRMTVPAGLGGKYLLNAVVQYPNTVNTIDRRIGYRINAGSDILVRRDYYTMSGSTGAYLNASFVVDLAAGDYIEVRGYVDSAAQTSGVFYAQLVKLDSGRVGQGIGCSVSGTSTAVTSASLASLAFGAADTFDTDGFHDPVTNNTRLTVPAGLGGKYLLTALAAYPNTTNVNTQERLGYRINAGTDILMFRNFTNNGGAGVSTIGEFATVVDLVAGDYVEVRAWVTNATSPQTLTSYSAQLTRLDSGGSAYTGALWGSGTAFPAGPATNQRFTRTDLGRDYYYDGTRWVTTELHQGWLSFGVLPAGASTSAVVVALGPGPMSGPDWYVTTIDVATRVITTNTGSAYWTVEAYKANSTTETILGSSFTTAADAANDRVTHTITVNAVVASGTEWTELIATKTGSPGNLYVTGLVNYRLVGT